MYLTSKPEVAIGVEECLHLKAMHMGKAEGQDPSTRSFYWRQMFRGLDCIVFSVDSTDCASLGGNDTPQQASGPQLDKLWAILRLSTSRQ